MNYYDGIIFDLDGTLWETTDSYLFAYHEILKNHKEITEKHSDEEVKKTMGFTMDIVGKLVFSAFSLEKQISLMREALSYSCAYLLTNENTCYEGVIETLKQLSQTTKLFIVSNCPKEYIEVFFEKTGTKEYFTDYKYLTETTNKKINVMNIIEEYNIKNGLLVGDSMDDFNSTLGDFAYVTYGYKHCDNYTYRINHFSELLTIIDYVNYRESILINTSFSELIKQSDSQVVLLKNDYLDKYIFGFLRLSSHNDNNELLFRKLENRCKEFCIKEIIGPIDYSTWFTYRLATDNFDWKLYPDINNTSFEIEFLNKNGFEKDVTYASTLAEIDYELWRTCKKVHFNDEYKIITAHGKEAFNYIEDIYDVSTNCFTDAYLYSPIDFDMFKNSYIKNIALVNPDIVLMYHKDKPIGFNFCFEDIKKRFYVCKTIGVKKEYQNSKVILKLIDVSYEMMSLKGYNEVLYHFQNEQKNELTRVWEKTLLKKKHYALYKKVF